MKWQRFIQIFKCITHPNWYVPQCHRIICVWGYFHNLPGVWSANRIFVKSLNITVKGELRQWAAVRSFAAISTDPLLTQQGFRDPHMCPKKQIPAKESSGQIFACTHRGLEVTNIYTHPSISLLYCLHNRVGLKIINKLNIYFPRNKKITLPLW